MLECSACMFTWAYAHARRTTCSVSAQPQTQLWITSEINCTHTASAATNSDYNCCCIAVAVWKLGCGVVATVGGTQSTSMHDLLYVLPLARTKVFLLLSKHMTICACVGVTLAFDCLQQNGDKQEKCTRNCCSQSQSLRHKQLRYEKWL